MSDILNKLSFNSAFYFNESFPPGWGMQIPDSEHAQFHIITAGSCHLQSKESKPVSLSKGDIAVFPWGSSHMLFDGQPDNLIPGKEVVKSLQLGQPPFAAPGKATSLVCGHFEIDKQVQHPFIQNLPEIIIIKTDFEQVSLNSMLDILLNESNTNGPGSAAIIKRLSESVFIEVLRIHSQNSDNKFLMAIQDEQIGEVLSRIHSNIQFGWTIEKMAQATGMSRATLAKKFKESTGLSPMVYLTKWRMSVAKKLLESNQPIYGVAQQVGYGSEAAFSRIFKKTFGQTPGTIRENSTNSSRMSG